MNVERNEYRGKEIDDFPEMSQVFKRHFWWPFKKKSKKKVVIRPGALSPEKVKEIIQGLGIGKQVEIMRIGYDGEIDDMPIMVELINITDEGFTGRIINVERQMIESATAKLVYARSGGGIIDFRFDDGDIKEISVSQDQELIEQERNIESLKEILQALDAGDHVIVAYYDTKARGTLNAEGTILKKSEDSSSFDLKIERINRIELEQKKEKSFNIDNDLVIDIEMV